MSGPTTPLSQSHRQRQGLNQTLAFSPLTFSGPLNFYTSLNLTKTLQVCQMPRAALEEARTAYGTDEDVIFVFPTSSEQ